MTAIELPTNAPASTPLVARSWVTDLVAGAALVTAVGAVVLGLRSETSPGLVDQNIPGTIVTFVVAALFTVVGWILQRRHLEHSVGWVLLLFGAVASGTSIVWAVTYVAGLPGGDRALGTNVAFLGAIVSAPSWTYLATSLVVRFPSGTPASAADARLLRVSGVVCVIAAGLAILRPGQFMVYPAFSNPLVLPASVTSVGTVAAPAAVVGALILLGIAAWGMVGRYQRAAQIERLQLRWFAFAALIGLVGGGLYVIFGILVAPNDTAVAELTYLALLLSICGFPIAILEAITRHRLYEIDRIIGRAFAYGALTAILAGLYAASLRLFNALFVSATGESSEAALVLTTLVLATTFTPIKSSLERLAARRFKSEAPEGASAVAAVPPAMAVVDIPAPAASVEGPDDATVARLEARIEANLDARIEAAVRRAVDAALLDSSAPGRRGPES